MKIANINLSNFLSSLVIMTGGLFLCLTISKMEIVVVTKSVITTILVPHHLMVVGFLCAKK